MADVEQIPLAGANEIVDLSGPTFNAIIGGIRQNRRAGETVDRIGRRFRERRTFTAKLTGKTEIDHELPDESTARIIAYSWELQAQTREYIFGDPVEGETPWLTSTAAADDFAWPAYNLAEMHLYELEHSGLDIPESGPYPIVEITIHHNRDTGGTVAFFDRKTDPNAQFIVGKITAVTGASNATYDAESLEDPSISVTGERPTILIMSDSYAKVPASVDDRCMLLKEGSSVTLWQVPEVLDPDVC